MLAWRRAAGLLAAAGVLAGCGDDTPAARGPVVSVPVLLVQPAGESDVRVVVEEGGCRYAREARTSFTERTVRVRVVGDAPSPSSACTAESTIRCFTVALGEPIGTRRLLPRPRLAADVRADAERAVAGRCHDLARG